MTNLLPQPGQDTLASYVTDVTFDHVRALAPHNRHLVEDRWIEDCMIVIPTTQTSGEDEDDEYGRSIGWLDGWATARVIVHSDLSLDYTPQAYALPKDHGPVSRKPAATCSRCSGISVEGYNFFDYAAGPYRVLWIAKGETIAEFVFCLNCADFYERNFSPVHWKYASDDAVQR